MILMKQNKKLKIGVIIKLFDEKDKLVYRGVIDDNARKPHKVKHTFLADAMDALLTGEKIDPVSTKALGCSIKFK